MPLSIMKIKNSWLLQYKTKTSFLFFSLSYIPSFSVWHANPPPSSSCRMNLFEFWGLIEPFFFASHSHDRKSIGFLFLTKRLRQPSLSGFRFLKISNLPLVDKCLCDMATLFFKKQSMFIAWKGAWGRVISISTCSLLISNGLIASLCKNSFLNELMLGGLMDIMELAFDRFIKF